MNNTFKVMLAYGFAVVTGFAGTVQAAVYEEFKMTDQPFMFFKTFGKCPYAIHYEPAVNQLNYTFLGSLDAKTSQIILPKKGHQLETLIPVRYTQKFVDANVQIDRKYAGWRESRISQALETGLQTLEIVPKHTFEGTFLVNEYKLGIPMKWVLRNIEDFKGMKAYLTKKFADENIVPTKKPLLLLEIAKDADALDASDRAFLNSYFEMLDPKDPAVKTFFNDCQKTLLDVASALESPKNVLETYPEMVLNALEKENEEFKGKEFAVKVTMAICAIVSSKLILDMIKEFVTDPATSKVKNYFRGKGKRARA